MSQFAGVIGHFGTADEFHDAIRRAKGAKIQDYTAYLPLPDDSELHSIDDTTSPVRWFSLVGGLTGICTALAITILCSRNYPLIVGGKSVVSWPPFLVISFELMVLFGTFGSLIGFGWLARFPHVMPAPGYRPDLAIDTFGLFVPCEQRGGNRVEIEQLLEDAGAEEIRAVYQ